MAHKIQIKRGNKADLPVLNDGEMGLCIDTQEVFVGSNGTNIPVGVQTEIVNNLTTTTAGKALDATQGKALAEQISTHKASGASHSKTAKFVIGTSTAGWTAADCDYLCDGTADQTEINAAITALPATGGEIVILDGTYNITAKINVTKDNVSIRGNGNATILKRMFDSSVAEGVITLTSRSGCKIANLQIEGNKTSYTNGKNYGIYLNASSNNTVTGNTCNYNSYGIYLTDSSNNNNTVTGNTCNYNSYGIYLRGSGNNNNTVTGNTCTYNNYGIYLNASSNNTVTGNTCTYNNYGIYLTDSSNNTVTGNTCNNNNDYGIYLRGSGNNTVTSNTCTYNNYGIYLSTANNNNTVTGNTCTYNSYGIYLNASSNNTVTGNTCNNNNDYGIYLRGSGNNTVTSNTCSNNNNYGIRLVTSSNNTVTGNTCTNNSYGIYLTDSSNNTVTGNTCIRGTGLATDYTASQHTIQLNGTSNSYNLIAMNNCMGKAVTSGGGTGNTLVNNKFDAT